jgi:hypothetical protein
VWVQAILTLIYFGQFEMKRFVFVALLGVFLSSHPVWAEMYRYKDAGGIIRYSDNLADVPEKQRTGIPVYENAPAPAVPSVIEPPSGRNVPSGQNLKIPEKTMGGDTGAVSLQSEEIKNDPSQIDRLLKIKTALDEENAQFMKESLTLSEEKKGISGNAAIKVYNEKVKALNERVADYEKRRAAFQKEADAFDAGLKKRLLPSPQSPKSSSP